jgi:ATP synthase F1 delta subunit
MNDIRETIIQRYTRAILRIIPSEQIVHQSEKLHSIRSFFVAHKILFLSLQLSIVTSHKRQKFFDILQHAYEFDTVYSNLLSDLVEKNRISLFGDILGSLVEKAHEQQGIWHVKVISSHELSGEQRLKVIHFAQRHITGQIKATFVVNQALISGVRIISSRYLWERSIAKKLRMVEQEIKVQGVLG